MGPAAVGARSHAAAAIANSRTHRRHRADRQRRLLRRREPARRRFHAHAARPPRRLIAAVAPRRGLLVAAGFGDARSFAVLHEFAVRESSGSRRISDVVLLVRDGAVVGIARASDTPRPKQPGWLGHLFRRN